MQIAIVGAGITGSLLARKLSDAGHTPVVFEKSRGRGGRCTFKRTSWAEFDLGAPVVPAWDPAFIDFMQRQVQKGLAHNWPAQVSEYNQQVSPIASHRQQFLFSGGMNSACKVWLDGVDLTTNCRIEAAQKQAGKWWLIDSEQQQYGPFHWLVITAPWPQTAELLKGVTDTIGQGPVQQWSSTWTAAVQFSQPIKSDAEIIYLKNAALQTLVQDSAKPGRSQANQVWVAHMSHALSEQLGKQGEPLVMDYVLRAFRQVFGQHIPEIQYQYLHFWRYARPAVGQPPLGIIDKSEYALAAGGDWSCGASVQAAYQAASKLAELIKVAR